MIILLIFVGVFAVVALLLYCQRLRGSAQKAKQVRPRSNRPWRPKARRCATRSSTCARTSSSAPSHGSTPGCCKLESGRSSQTLIHQADLKWTAGSLLSMCGVCFAVPAYAGSLEDRHLPHWRCWPAWSSASLPIGYRALQAQQALRRVREGTARRRCDLMVSALRAGQSLIAAMGMVARECTDPDRQRIQNLLRRAELRPRTEDGAWTT